MNTATTATLPIINRPLRWMDDSLSVEQETNPDQLQSRRSHIALRMNLSRVRSPLGFSDSELAEAQVTSSNMSEEVLRIYDPQSQYLAELQEMMAEVQKMSQAYAQRLEELRECASEDDECSDMRESSKEDFWWFVKSMPWARKAELVLLDNGNLRAVWKGDDKAHIGLQFLGDQLGEYVIFTRRPGAMKVSRVAGIDTLEGLKKQVRAFDISLLENR